VETDHEGRNNQENWKQVFRFAEVLAPIMKAFYCIPPNKDDVKDDK
jgi:hypothetical protein